MICQGVIPRRVVIWAGAASDTLQPGSPNDLAADHPVWAETVDALSPWRRAEASGGSAWWEATGAETPEPVLLCRRSSSTQDGARWLVERGILGVGGSVLAASQSAGRGRMGRPWISVSGNLHATWIGPAGVEGAGTALTPLAAGLAVARALEDLGLSAAIKWPNDVLVSGRKVAGILTETSGTWTLTGIGVNTCWCPRDATLRLEGSIPATTLAEQGLRLGPLAVWLAILRTGRSELEQWTDPREAAGLCKRIESRLAWIGEEVTVHESGRQVRAFPCRIMGLDPDGSLRVRRAGQVIAIQTGRLSRVER
jgi:BirA family transcriptional regulator, biotin operon repressor / biotin---[acetyl-CoA-carboxylase] ligase